MILTKISTLGFKGPAHSDNFLRSFRKVSHLQADDGLDEHADFYDRGALPSRRFSNHSHIRLPPIDIARQLFAAQYTYIGTIFSFSDPASFERLCREAYQGPPDLGDQRACLTYAKMLVILAFGKLYSVNQWIDYNGPPGFEYLIHALELLPDVHEEGSILFVETLALVGYFMQNLNRRDAAFLYVGMALRMAITLGLHQEPSDAADLDAAAREHRRRVWWSVYSLDRIQSVKSGNPITIHDEDVGVRLPSRLPGEPDYCAAVVLRHYTKLSRICGEITVRIYRRAPKKSGTELMAAVRQIILSLSQWRRELPDQLRFDPARLGISRESVSTLLHYSQCINMTARPLLFHVVQKRLRAAATAATLGEGEEDRNDAAARDWKDGLTQTTVKVIEMCVAAAQDTINMMTIAAQKNLVATYGYMDSEHAFSAAIVLVMVCVAFPAERQNTDSMHAALDLLRSMSQKGNSHMAARFELLDRIRATFIPAAHPPPSSSAVAWRLGAPGQGFDSSPRGTAASPTVARQTPPVPSSAPSWRDDPHHHQQAACARQVHLPADQAAAVASSSRIGSTTDTTDTTPAATTTSNNINVHSGLHVTSGLFPPQAGGVAAAAAQMPDFTFLTNPSLGEGMFYDVDMTGVGGNNNQDFWEEAFANPAGDPGNTLMESLEWTQVAMDQFGFNGEGMSM